MKSYLGLLTQNFPADWYALGLAVARKTTQKAVGGGNNFLGLVRRQTPAVSPMKTAILRRKIVWNVVVLVSNPPDVLQGHILRTNMIRLGDQIIELFFKS